MVVRVSKQEVFDAAEKIFASGINPVAPKVRKEIGRGSYSDICPFLKEWKATNNSSEYKGIVESMPEELKLLGVQTGNNIAKTIWVEALNFAQDKVKLEMFAVIENENQQLRDEIMHYKEMEVELRTMKEFQSTFTQTLESRIEKEKENEQKIQKLEKVVADLLKEKVQNK